MTNAVKRVTGFFLALAVLLAFLPALSAPAYAETKKTVTVDGFIFDVYLDEANKPSSVWIAGYSGTDKDLVLPTHLVYNGVKCPVQEVNDNAFKGNKNITSVVVPNGYTMIGAEAFAGCTNLKEVTLGDASPDYYSLGENAFADCGNLKTYRIGNQPGEWTYVGNVIGRDRNGNILDGVTVYLIAGSRVDKQLQKENDESKKSGGKELNLKYETNPAAKANVTKVIPSKADPSKQKGEDGTPYGKGASAVAMENAILKWASEADPAGTVYNGLQAKITKVTKNSLLLSWQKVKGAKNYVVYGNQCGKTKKMTKLLSMKKNALKVKKVLGKKLKKGTYYKFVVVALDARNNVISTSKAVHAATLGGKVGNDKLVKTAAKKNKVLIKKGKTFKLKAKAVPQSKKLKVKRHRLVKFETTNKKVATVTAKGIIKGTGKGACYVYAYAQNGVAAKIKVTVK